MPDMTESYSEILGRPLFMKVSEEAVLRSMSRGQSSVQNECNSSNHDALTTEDCSIYEKQNTSPSTLNNSVKSSQTSNDVIPDEAPKQSKPSSLPCLTSEVEGSYLKYYSNASCDEGSENELKTPVYEDMDPGQAILSHHRLAAYLASPDYCEENDQDLIQDKFNFEASTSQSLPVGKCGPELAEAALKSAGTVTRLPNNTVSFVADDLHQKIKLSSPVSAGSGASTPKFNYPHPYQQYYSGGSGSSMPPSLPHRPPPLDPTLLNDIERHARKLATNVDNLIESLTDALHGISALTVDCVETYRDTVCKTCDAVDANIKSMYQLMAKGEELSKSMKPVYGLHAQIKDVRRTLDILESEMHSSGS